MPVQTTAYTPSKTVKEFMMDPRPIKIINGPVGSGKSVGCVMEIAKQCMEQEPGPDGIRRSRWAVIRNTNQQLKDTTLKTWLQWFPDGGAGRWKESDKTFYLKFNDVEAEIMFRPLDSPADLQRLLSLELTSAYFNELRELDETIFNGVRTRIGRYPSPKDVRATNPSIIADTNPPDMDSWVYELMENPGPRDRELIAVFKQPGGLEPDAENVENLPPGYYENMMIGATQDFIDVHVHGKYGKSNLGKPVHQIFNETLHVQRGMQPEPGTLVVVGMDFGLTPAAVFKQMDGWGHVRTLAEAYTFDMYLEQFLDLKVLPILRSAAFAQCPVLVIGDPSGKIRSADKGQSCFDMLDNKKLVNMPAPTNDPVVRIGAPDHYMSMIAGDGRPVYQVDKRCEFLIKALRGGYKYKKQKTTGELSATPDKGKFSHLAEANQYADMFYQHGMEEKYARRVEMQKQFEDVPAYQPFDSDVGY